jgi:hypothetical protein
MMESGRLEDINRGQTTEVRRQWTEYSGRRRTQRLEAE